MWFWTITLAVVVTWGIITFFFFLDSTENLNVLSVIALWLACGAGFQATLGMRKADPEDPL
jgi:hypothetical protein